MTHQAALRCFFCGKELASGGPGQYRCGGCRAEFRAETDPEGCVIALQVAGCGADECCRNAKKPAH